MHSLKVSITNFNALCNELFKSFCVRLMILVLMLWSSGELKTFVNLVVRHVIDPGPSLSVIGQSIRLIYANCEQV